MQRQLHALDRPLTPGAPGCTLGQRVAEQRPPRAVCRRALTAPRLGPPDRYAVCLQRGCDEVGRFLVQRCYPPPLYNCSICTLYLICIQ